MSENPNLLTTFPFSSLRSSRCNPQLTRPSRLAAGRHHLMRLCVRQRAAHSSCVRAASPGPARAPRQRRLTCWRADRLEPGTASSWRVAAWSTGAAPPGRSGPAARPHAQELLVPRGRCLMRPWPALAAPRMQAAALGRALVPQDLPHADPVCAAGQCAARALPPTPRATTSHAAPSGGSATVHADDRRCA